MSLLLINSLQPPSAASRINSRRRLNVVLPLLVGSMHIAGQTNALGSRRLRRSQCRVFADCPRCRRGGDDDFVKGDALAVREARIAALLQLTTPSTDSAAKGRMVNMRFADGSRCKSGTVAPR
jgi:hypothetical protein